MFYVFILLWFRLKYSSPFFLLLKYLFNLLSFTEVHANQLTISAFSHKALCSVVCINLHIAYCSSHIVNIL